MSCIYIPTTLASAKYIAGAHEMLPCRTNLIMVTTVSQFMVSSKNISQVTYKQKEFYLLAIFICANKIQLKETKQV